MNSRMLKQTSPSPRSRGRRRISVSLSESKTLNLYQQGRHLLAIQDFDDISVAQFAKAAGLSVGAFYVRFADKDAFLDFVTVQTFNSAQRNFEQAMLSIVDSKRPAELLADTLIMQLAERDVAGIVRLTIKRGFTDPRHRGPLDAYRAFVRAQVQAALPTDPSSDKAETLDQATTAASGILIDAIVCSLPDTPLHLSENRDVIIKLLSGPLAKVKLRKPASVTKVQPSRPTKL